jgi:bifunctional non-homologous end joining protein LigD
MNLLQRYHEKRDFGATPEPRGEAGASGERLMFVVQKHDASALHYDFRLEIDGVLKSWAVPRGPSLNPAEKRLAMMTEDHPLDYAGFEGAIPEGQYGAGEVIVWDTGEFVPQHPDLSPVPPDEANGEASRALAAGSLKFELRGQKLSGSWALVQMHSREPNAWLLIKHKDEAADRVHAVTDQVESVLSGRILKRDQKSS